MCSLGIICVFGSYLCSICVVIFPQIDGQKYVYYGLKKVIQLVGEIENLNMEPAS